MGRISEDEYKAQSDKYGMNDYIGKLGIEYIFEDYLKGEDGLKQVDMDINGVKVAEYETQQAIQGSRSTIRFRYNINNRCKFTKSYPRCINEKFRKNTKW